MVDRENRQNLKNELVGSTPALPDGLDEKRYLRIGEVSELTGVKPYVLRYWESEFRWMSPAKSKSRQRLYKKRDIERILLIRRLLHEERYTIAGAKKKLKDIGADGIHEALSQPFPESLEQEDTGNQMSLGLSQNKQVKLAKIRKDLIAIKKLI